MKDLSRHIEYLLCEHDSVAVPGIGTFVTEELPARYYPEEGLFLPPVRSVRLDTTIHTDDHKLEDCLIQLHHVARSTAQAWIAEYIDDINQSIMDMGIMDMGTIGRLVATEDGIAFEVCESGVNSPELYGLDSFHISKLPAYAHRDDSSTDRTHLTIRLRRSTIHRIMTAAAMLVVALTVIVPNYGSFDNKGLQASMNTAESLTNIFSSTTQPISHPIDGLYSTQKPMDEDAAAQLDTIVTSLILNETIQDTVVPEEMQDTAALMESENTSVPHYAQNTSEQEMQIAAQTEIPAQMETKAYTEKETKADNISAHQETTLSTDIVAENSTPAQTETKAEIQPNTSLQAKGFCIVMASAITKKGAELLIAKLNKEGFTNAIMHKDKDMLRVLLTGYEDENSARSHMAIVKAADKLYSGSWIKKF